MKLTNNCSAKTNFNWNKSKLSTTTNQIVNEYLTKSDMCNAAVKDCFKCFIITIGKCE